VVIQTHIIIGVGSSGGGSTVAITAATTVVSVKKLALYKESK